MTSRELILALLDLPLEADVYVIDGRGFGSVTAASVCLGGIGIALEVDR